MTLFEAYEHLKRGEKLTYPGLDGYIVLKNGKLFTELDAESAFKRSDWKVTDGKVKPKEEPKKESHGSRMEQDPWTETRYIVVY